MAETGLPDSAVDELERATELASLRRFDAARAAVSAVLADHPENVPALGVLAAVELDGSAPQAAFAAVERAIAAGGDDPTTRLLRARALGELGHAGDAVDAARDVLTDEPEHVDGHVCLARLLVTSGGDLDAAREHADRAIALAPDDAAGHLALAAVHRAQRTWYGTARARTSFERALRLAPDNAEARSGLGLVELSRRPGRSIGLFAGILRQSPNHATALNNLPSAVFGFLEGRWRVLLAAMAASYAVAIAAEIAAEGAGQGVGLPAHLVAVAAGCALAWWLVLRWLLTPFPPTMRAAAAILLRRDPTMLPLLVGTVWIAVCCGAVPLLVWFTPVYVVVLSIPVAVAGYRGCGWLAGRRAGEVTKQVRAARKIAWAVAARAGTATDPTRTPKGAAEGSGEDG